MNLAWLSTLKEVADAHSYTKAAEKLFISQPAASQHVSQLEKVFGTRLIQRLGQDLQLTEAGRQVYDMACLFEVELEATRGRVHDLIGSSKSTLTIVGAPTPLLHTLPQILKRLWDTHPQVAVNTRVKFGAEVLTAVRTGFADVGILTSVHLDGSLPVTPLGASQIICISSPNHVLACKSRISTEEASRHRIAITGIGTAVRTFVGDWFAQQGSFLENTMDVSSAEEVRIAALENLAIGFAGSSVVADDIAAGRLVKLDLADFEVSIPVYLTHRREIEEPPLSWFIAAAQLGLRRYSLAD